MTRAVSLSGRSVPFAKKAAMMVAREAGNYMRSHGKSMAKKAFKKGTKALKTYMSKGKAPKRKLNPTYNSKPRKAFKKGKTLKSRVSRLERDKNRDWSFKTLRRTDCSIIRMAVFNEGLVASFPFVVGSDFQTAMSTLKFFNPSAPATLIEANLSSAAYPQDILVKWYRKLDLVNNYIVPVMVEVWRCDVKLDTTISPQQAWINGCADNPSGSIDIDAMYVYPSDSKELNDLFRVKKVLSKKLLAGQGISTFANSKGWINFDPATFDDHANNYQRQYDGGAFLVKITGCIAHDTSVAEVGFALGGLDAILYTVTTVKYDSGGSTIRDLILDNNCDTFSNVALQSNKPVADNQAYSVS